MNSFGIDKTKHPNIVAVGVDTLELNIGVDAYADKEVFKMLESAKSEAASLGYKGRQGTSVEFMGVPFKILPRGSKGGYPYLLQNGDVEFQIMPDARGGNPSPEIRAILRSELLWREGDISAYNKIMEVLQGIASLRYCRVSRADLCVDRVMPLPEVDRLKQVVTLAREKDAYYGGDFQRGQRITGLQIGRGEIVCRFYDKVLEIAMKGHAHIKPVWTNNGWDGKSTVSRLEFQLRRGGLRRFDQTMDYATYQECKPDIWAYMTDKFLRMVDPGTATRKERAKATDYWVDFQECTNLFGERKGILPYKETTMDWIPLVKQGLGCLASAWARLAANVGEAEATAILEKAWGNGIPPKVIEAGVKQKAMFAHFKRDFGDN
jgi:hypothetical protein